MSLQPASRSGLVQSPNLREPRTRRQNHWVQEHAANKFSAKGFEYAEADPVKNLKSDAYNFPGPLSMYLKNGFTE